MDELVANPDGCGKFIPNPFKKEKCKDCGRPWYEHKGVITEDQIGVYLKARQKEADAKREKEEAEVRAAKAKKLAQKQKNRTPTDDWFNEGGAQEDPNQDDESDDECGFRMLMPGDLGNSTASQPARSAGEVKQIKIKNLIDFDECDVQDEPPRSSSAAASSAGPIVPSAQDEQPIGVPSSSHMAPHAAPSSPSNAASARFPSAGAVVASGPSSAELEELNREVEHLRQMLADANEEKAIQVEIIQDEVKDKQKEIETLQRQRAEAETSLKETREKLEAERQRADRAQEVASSAEEDRVSAQESDRHKAEATELREEVERQRSSSQSYKQQAEQYRGSAQALQDDVDRMRAQSVEQQEQAELAAKHQAEAELQRESCRLLQEQVDLLRTQLAEYQEQASSTVAISNAEPTALVSEVLELCRRLRDTLSIDGNDSLVAPSRPSTATGDLEADLRLLRDVFSGDLALAEKLATENRQIVNKLRDAERNAEQTQMALRDAERNAEKAQMALAARPLPQQEGSGFVLSAASEKENLPEGAQMAPTGYSTPQQPSAEAQQAVAHIMGLKAAQALKEIRLNAEEQLAWISKRMRITEQANFSPLDIRGPNSVSHHN